MAQGTPVSLSLAMVIRVSELYTASPSSFFRVPWRGQKLNFLVNGEENSGRLRRLVARSTLVPIENEVGCMTSALLYTTCGQCIWLYFSTRNVRRPAGDCLNSQVVVLDVFNDGDAEIIGSYELSISTSSVY